MATRLYFTQTSVQDPLLVVTPDSIWDDVATSFRRRYLETSKLKDNGSGNLVSPSIAPPGTPYDVLITQFFLDGLEAQTISGTVKGQLRCRESNVAADAFIQCVIKVINPANGNVRGTLLSASSVSTISAVPGAAGYELDPGAVSINRKLPTGWSGAGASLSSVDAEEGDVLLVEVGARFLGTGLGRSVTITPEMIAASADQPENETNNTILNSWIEFSSLAIQVRAEVLGGIDTDDWSRVTDIRELDGEPDPLIAGQLWPRGAGNG